MIKGDCTTINQSDIIINETMELSRTIREKSIKNVLVLCGNQLIYFVYDDK
jgi:hypothetical protein